MSKSATNNAYQYTSDEEAESIWSEVPSNIDILVTHGPPLDIFDGTIAPGCPVLRHHVEERIRPKLHIFGHWHVAPGSKMIGNTVYINAATVDFDYAVSHYPIVFDLPLT